VKIAFSQSEEIDLAAKKGGSHFQKSIAGQSSSENHRFFHLFEPSLYD
jgi:hypothetical protein